MFARTTRRAGAMADACCCELSWFDFCAHHKNQGAGRRKYFLGAASVISRPVFCQFSSAGKHFLFRFGIVFSSGVNYLHSGGNIQSE